MCPRATVTMAYGLHSFRAMISIELDHLATVVGGQQASQPMTREEAIAQGQNAAKQLGSMSDDLERRMNTPTMRLLRAIGIRPGVSDK